MKRVTVLLVIVQICFCKLSDAQNITPSFAAIYVSNIDSSVTWYKQVFNLTQRNRTDNAERGFKQVVLINDIMMLELVELKKSIRPDSLLRSYPRGTWTQGVYKIGFTVDDMDAAHKELTAKNVKFFGKMVTDPVNNKRTFLVTDPDGNLVQFFER